MQITEFLNIFQDFPNIIRSESIYGITELTLHWKVFSLAHDLGQFFLTKADQRPFHPLTGAITFIGHFLSLQEYNAQIAADLSQNILRCHTQLQHGCDRAGSANPLLQLFDGLLGSTGK